MKLEHALLLLVAVLALVVVVDPLAAGALYGPAVAGAVLHGALVGIGAAVFISLGLLLWVHAWRQRRQHGA